VSRNDFYLSIDFHRKLSCRLPISSISGAEIFYSYTTISRMKFYTLFGYASVLTIFISSTFSVLRPLYFDFSTSTSLLRPLFLDLLSNLDFLLVEASRGHRFCKVQVKVKSVGRTSVTTRSKYRKGLTDAYPRVDFSSANCFI